ncbi:unnamed protein product [Debaryomyces tyrocola]|nr:unnamed protein product [Debaryomyces tyrocola]
MNSSTSIGSLLLQHPLYQATERCIDRKITDTYKYLDFFSTWNRPILDYGTIIRELFKVDENELKPFILEGDPKRRYLDCVSWIFHCNQQITKKILRFVLSLPMLSMKSKELVCLLAVAPHHATYLTRLFPNSNI